MSATLTQSPKLTLTSEFLRGACMMELNELLHTKCLKDWGIEVNPHPHVTDWKVAKVWAVMLHKESAWEIYVVSDDLDTLRNDLWIQSEVINQWINE